MKNNLIESNEKLNSIPSSNFNTPILFLVFNRLDTTIEVFREIKKVKPAKLFVACDGARETRPGEQEKVAEIRSFILNNIDWNCEVKTLFREKNLGCKFAVSGAITWFFQNVEKGIILEDDCLPNDSFFKFCEECLEKYRTDDRIFQVNGTSVINKEQFKESYFFSKYNHIWGWATWRRAWEKYEIENKNFEIDFSSISKRISSLSERKFWYKIFKNYFDGNIDTWDYPWVFTTWKYDGLAISPKYNMIRNIGTGHIEATHTVYTDEKIAKAKFYAIDHFIHPSEVIVNNKLDAKDYAIRNKKAFILSRIIKKLFRMVNTI